MSMDELSTIVEKEEEKTKSTEENFQAEVDMKLGSGRRDPIAPREEVGLEGPLRRSPRAAGREMRDVHSGAGA